MRILAVTGNRADYDLMSYLYKKLNKDEQIDFRLLVTGAHLTPGYESSVEEMKLDGNQILMCIENILSADSIKSRAKSIGILIESFVDAVDMFGPQLIIGVGDREEVAGVALAAAYMKIPFMHFFGGDYVSDGHVDNLARNVASKLATVHAVSMEEHKQRLIAMGEEEHRIYNIGSTALDKYREEAFIEKKELLEKYNCQHFDDYALVIYHPPTDIHEDNHEIRNILKALKQKGIKAFISYPNTDFNNGSVIKEFDQYANDKDFYFYRNFNRNTFINIYRNAAFQIGNSSAGICESASIPIAAINVGSRQRDRRAQENVLFVDGALEDIEQAIDQVCEDDFRKKISCIENQYGDGESSERAYQMIKETDFAKLLLKTSDPLRSKL